MIDGNSYELMNVRKHEGTGYRKITLSSDGGKFEWLSGRRA